MIRLSVYTVALLCALPAEARNRRGEGAGAALTVSAAQTELRGRPAMSSTVMGLVRRGETVQVVRRSADQRWIEIDIGGGELAWIDARAVRAGGGVEREPVEREPRPARARLARLEAPPAEEGMHRIEGRRDDEPEAPPAPRRRSASPSSAPVAQDDEQPAATQATTIVRRVDPPLPPHGRNYFDVHVRIGVAIPQHRVATNGISTGVLPAYQYSATNLAAGAQLGYSRAFGKFRIHLDARYLIATLGAVRYSDGTQLALRDQNIGGGLAIGGYFPAAGGIDLRVRVGAESWLTQITPSAAPLAISSEIMLGMAAGIELGMPAIFRIAGRPFGFRVQAGAIAPAMQMQSAGLDTGAKARTYGAYAGGAIQAGLLAPSKRGQVYLEAKYDYSMVLSRYTGVCSANADAIGTCRDMSVSDARNGFVSHIATLGLAYAY